MLVRLILLLIVAAGLELAILVEVYRAVAGRWGTGAGLLATLGSTLLTAAVGASLARRQGLATIRDLNDATSRGASPAVPLVDGALILVGAMLLLIPGFLSDLAGLVLLFPPTRRLARGVLVRRLSRRFARAEADLRFRIGPAGGTVIDVTPADDRPGPDSLPSRR